jgi:preprotein translocase subunit SecB
VIDGPSKPPASESAADSPPTSQRQSPGIHFSGVVVDRISFTDVAPSERKPDGLQFSFGIQRRHFENPDALEVTVIVRIAPRPGEAISFKLEAAVTGRFQKLDGPGVLSLEEFAKTNGPALVMPYVRELVTNISARTRHGTIIFPPVNVIALVADEAKGSSSPSTK